MRSGLIADHPGDHKNHVLKVSEESEIDLLRGERRFLKTRNNCFPVTRIKRQWPIKHLHTQQEDLKICEEKNT